MLSKENEQRLFDIFLPDINKKSNDIKSAGKRFVHYTSANAAMQILQNRQIWMRQPSCMNDFMEVEHGIECLVATYEKSAIRKSLEELSKGLSLSVEKGFDHLVAKIRRDLYLTCVSEHEDAEDSHGRLSMWRAYGKSAGVGMVLNQKPFFSESNVLKAISMPVVYMNNEESLTALNGIANNIKESRSFLESVEVEEILKFVLHSFILTVISAKHVGFSEEKEWRVICSPTIFGISEHLIPSIESVDGIPQEIYKLQLKNVPEEGVEGMEIKELIDRIIIGPTKYPLVLSKAFVRILDEAGVENPSSKVFISDIPLQK